MLVAMVAILSRLVRTILAAVTIDLEKVDKWVANGAKPTDTVARLIEAERKNA